jgi:TolB-like protein
VLALLLLIAAGYRFLGSRFAVPAAQSIAVLPFRNLSSDPDQAYFADGVVEMVRNHLSRVEALHVTSMTSWFN